MRKRFNDTGVCVKAQHFMVDITPKIMQILDMIENQDYFIINRPRQFGKTTALFRLYTELLKKEEYLVILLSFEGIGEVYFQSEDTFQRAVVSMLNRELKNAYPAQTIFINENFETLDTGLDKLSLQISDFVGKVGKQVVVLIDEVDKSTNNQLFLHFLGMLRNKYLKRDLPNQGTFHSVVLVGVHDVKTIKLKIRPDEEKKLNSPWNIAVDFKVNMSFSPAEIEGMLRVYSAEKQIDMDCQILAERLYYYTSGYPFLVSKMCKVVDEILLPEKDNKQEWTLQDIENAFRYLVKENYTTTIFDDLFKNIENNRELHQLVKDVVLNGLRVPFNANDYLIELAATYGVFDRDAPFCRIHNRIFEQRIYFYYIAQAIRKGEHNTTELIGDSYSSLAGELNIPKILRKFQAFMQENYSAQDAHFIEREGRLLFLSFLKPIINGRGFDFKEPNIGEERRMDIVITYTAHRYILELKIWRGEEYHTQGIKQLAEYLDLYQQKEGYLLIFNFNKNKAFKEETIQIGDKTILAVWV